MNPQYLGWLTCVLCLFYTLRCASVFAKTNANIYFALSIYAANWGVLIVYYSSMINIDFNNLQEFLPALSGYCCVIAGSIIYRDHNKRLTKKLELRERLLAWLLLFMVMPKGLELLQLHINHYDTEVFVTLILKIIGFYSLFLASKVSTNKKAERNMVTSFLVVYTIIEFAYTYMWFYNKYVLKTDIIVMDTPFLYGFSIIKLLVCFSFVPIALTHCHEFQKLNFKEKVLHFFHLD